MTVVPREETELLAVSSNLKSCSRTPEAGSASGSDGGDRAASGDGPRTGSGEVTSSGVFSSGSGGPSAGGFSSGSSGPAMTAAAEAMAAAAATAAAGSFPKSAALGPRLTGVGVLLPTLFLGLVVFVAAALEAGVLLGVDLLSCGFGRVGVFESAALPAGGFLAGASVFDLGVSGLAAFVAGEERDRGESAGFLAAAVVDLVTSFFTGVVVLDVCDVAALPPEGALEVVLEAAGLVAVVLGAAGLDVAAVELLVVLVVGGRVEPVAGRDDAGVPAVGLAVLVTGGLVGA